MIITNKMFYKLKIKTKIYIVICFFLLDDLDIKEPGVSLYISLNGIPVFIHQFAEKRGL